MLRLLCALATLVLFTAAAAAQQQLEAVDVGSSAVCPPSDALDQLVGGRGGAQVGLGFTFVIASAADVFRGSPPASPPIQVHPAQFAKVLLFGQSLTGTKRILVSWQQGTERKCGWMDAKDLLIHGNARVSDDFYYGPKPLRVSEVDANERDSLLTVKAVGANLDTEGNKGIEAFTSPKGGTVAQTLGLFEIYTVYDQAQGTPPPGRHVDQYYLIGRSGVGEDQLYGWINAQDVYLWNSRLSGSWAGTGAGRGWLNDSMIGPPLMTEAKDYVEPADKVPDNARYPIIGQEPPTSEVQDKAAQLQTRSDATPLDFARLVKQYKMVVPGRACPRGVSDQSKCMTAEEIADARRTIAEKAASLQRVDIIFLIDGTISMDVYFPSTAQAVQAFINQILGPRDRQSDLTIRVGAAIYGDYLGDHTSAGIFYRNVVKLQNPAQSGDSHWLDALAAYRPGPESDPVNKDKLEAPFAALVQTATETPWASNAGIRVIVHIADHGNREEGKTSGEPQSSLVETLKLGTVIDELKKRNIIYIPINVIGRPKETEERAIQARKAFLEQAAAIKAGTFPDTKPVMRAYTTTDTQETPEQRTQAVLAALHTAVDVHVSGTAMDRLQELCARNPGGPSCDDLKKLESGTDAPTRIARELLDVMGLTRERVQNIESRVQTVSYVWVRPVEQKDHTDVLTLNYYVALDESGLNQMKGSVDCVCQSMKSAAPHPGDIEECLRKIVEGTAGQDVRPEQLLDMRRSLPVLEKSRALNMNLNILWRGIRNHEESVVATWRPAYCKSDYLLGLVRGGSQIDLSKILVDSETGVVRPTELPKNYRWLVKIGRGEGLWYVPINYLPQ